LASQSGHIEVVKLLLNHPKVDPSADNQYGMNFINLNIFKAIQFASRNGHVNVVKLLLNHPKVDPSAENNYGMSFIGLITYLKQFDWLHSMVILKWWKFF
jgi:ankyrin repeat protein